MFRPQQPLGKSQAILGQFRRHRRQDVRCVRLDLVAALVVLAAEQHVGHRRLAAFLLHIGDRAAAFDRGLLLFECGQLVGGIPVRLVQGVQPPGEQFIPFGVAPLLGRLGRQIGDSRAGHDLSGFLRGKRPAIDSQILERHIVQPRLGAPLSDFQRHAGADRAFQLVLQDSHALRLAVHKHLHAARFAGTVIGHQDVAPLAGFQRFVGHDLQRVFFPLADDVRARPAVFEPQVPAAIIHLVVHAREQRSAGVGFGQLDPRAERETLVLLEIARFGHFDRDPGGGFVRGGGDVSGLGRQGRRQRQRFGLAVDRHGHVVGRAVVQGGVKFQTVGRDGGRQVRRLGLRQPTIEVGPSRTAPLFDLLLGGGDFRADRVPPSAIFRQGHRQHRRRVLDVAIHHALGGVVEERRHFIELALRDRVEFVVVARRAVHGQPEPDPGGRLGAVAGVQHGILVGNHAAFVGGDVAAVEAGGDPLFQRGVGQQVARQLLDRELVERQVAVEGTDHPVAIGPDFAIVVEVDAVRVGIASGVQPVAAAVFTPPLGLQQLVHELLVRVRRGVVHERFHEFRRRRQAGQVQAQSPGQRAAIGFGSRFQTVLLQLGQDKGVDRIADPGRLLDRRQRRTHRRDVRPVRLVFGAGRHPALEQLFLLRASADAAAPAAA